MSNKLLMALAASTMLVTAPAIAAQHEKSKSTMEKSAQDKAMKEPNQAQQTSANPSDITIDGIRSYKEAGLQKGNLGSAWMGQTVYSGKNENIGEVSDLVIGSDKSIKAAVVDVGGFLGLGETSVIVPVDRFEMTSTNDNETKLTLDATKDELLKAAGKKS